MDRPIPDSYWVERGQFLAGEYPGSEDLDNAVAKVASLREAGVDFFLDLTEAGERGLRPYEHLIEGTGVTYQRFPVKDLTCPAHHEMSTILDTIDAALADGRTVYLHCWGGIGRTGTVVGCYLVRHGSPPDAALAQIAAWRSGTPDGRRESPETQEQRDFVLGWNEKVT